MKCAQCNKDYEYGEVIYRAIVDTLDSRTPRGWVDLCSEECQRKWTNPAKKDSEGP